MVRTYNDGGTELENLLLCPAEGRYGVNIPKGVWHTVESLESGTVLLECKEGPFVEHEVEGVMEVGG